MTVSIQREGDIAVVTVDNPPVNAAGRSVREGLVEAAEALDADAGVQAVVLLCAGRTFIAGADVREFGKPPEPPYLPDVVARLERADTPWVAAIHGQALGGGLEIALGCRFRVALPEAKLGLPEVLLGVVPGAGGTVRLPRTVGVPAAVEMVTTGRPVPAAKARQMALVDALIEGDLRAGAVAFARSALQGPLPPPVVERPVEAPEAAFWPEAESAVKRRAKGAEAPLRALACLRKATEATVERALAFERETFIELRDSDQAAALRHVFFAERAAARPADLKGIAPRPVRRAGVVGGGTMGAGIAAALRDAGLPVTLVERDDAAVQRGMDGLRRIYAGGVTRGKIAEAEAESRLAGVVGTTEYGALSEVDIVIEAVFEDLNVKREVFARLGAACRSDAVFATNTSYIDPRAIAEGLPGPERFIGLHFFSPANVMKLLEVVPVPQTADDVRATAFDLAKRLGKIPVQAGICEGFIGNRILKRYRSAAEALVREGAAIADIDAAMRRFGMAMGPFEAQDLGGLDIAFMQREAARQAGETVPHTLGDVLVRAGRKGQKTAAGWYDYAEGDRTPRPSADVERLLAPHLQPGGEGPEGEGLALRLVAEMAEEGAAILDERIAAAPEDVDLVEIHGYGFPRWRGGPLFHAARRGRAALATDLRRPPSPVLLRFLEQAEAGKA